MGILSITYIWYIISILYAGKLWYLYVILIHTRTRAFANRYCTIWWSQTGHTYTHTHTHKKQVINIWHILMYLKFVHILRCCYLTHPDTATNVQYSHHENSTQMHIATFDWSANEWYTMRLVNADANANIHFRVSELFRSVTLSLAWVIDVFKSWANRPRWAINTIILSQRPHTWQYSIALIRTVWKLLSK